jgi:hypothetical protein
MRYGQLSITKLILSQNYITLHSCNVIFNKKILPWCIRWHVPTISMFSLHLNIPSTQALEIKPKFWVNCSNLLNYLFDDLTCQMGLKVRLTLFYPHILRKKGLFTSSHNKTLTMCVPCASISTMRTNLYHLRFIKILYWIKSEPYTVIGVWPF